MVFTKVLIKWKKINKKDWSYIINISYWLVYNTVEVWIETIFYSFEAGLV